MKRITPLLREEDYPTEFDKAMNTLALVTEMQVRPEIDFIQLERTNTELRTKEKGHRQCIRDYRRRIRRLRYLLRVAKRNQKKAGQVIKRLKHEPFAQNPRDNMVITEQMRQMFEEFDKMNTCKSYHGARCEDCDRPIQPPYEYEMEFTFYSQKGNRKKWKNQQLGSCSRIVCQDCLIKHLKAAKWDDDDIKDSMDFAESVRKVIL